MSHCKVLCYSTSDSTKWKGTAVLRSLFISSWVKSNHTSSNYISCRLHLFHIFKHINSLHKPLFEKHFWFICLKTTFSGSPKRRLWNRSLYLHICANILTFYNVVERLRIWHNLSRCNLQNQISRHQLTSAIQCAKSLDWIWLRYRYWCFCSSCGLLFFLFLAFSQFHSWLCAVCKKQRGAVLHQDVRS